MYCLVPWWENYKICNCGSLLCAWTGQHSEDAGDKYKKEMLIFVGDMLMIRSNMLHCNRHLGQFFANIYLWWNSCPIQIYLESPRVAVIKTDAVHNAEIGKVVLMRKTINSWILITNFIEETNLVRSIVAMPGNNIEWRVVLFCLEKMALSTR